MRISAVRTETFRSIKSLDDIANAIPGLGENHRSPFSPKSCSPSPETLLAITPEIPFVFARNPRLPRLTWKHAAPCVSVAEARGA